MNNEKVVRSATAEVEMAIYGDEYLEKIRQAAAVGIPHMRALLELMDKPDRNCSQMFYNNVSRRVYPHSMLQLIQKAEDDRINNRTAVCVIENISPRWIKDLGMAWRIPPEFFALHASNPEQQHLWSRPRWNPSSGSDAFNSLVGVYEFHDLDVSISQLRELSVNYCMRHVFQDSNGLWPVNYSMRISYIRVSPLLYLFLVDPPISYTDALQSPAHPRTFPTLRLLYGQNRGGVLFPSTYPQTPFDPFGACKKIFGHGWQIELLTHPPEQTHAFPPVPLVYLFSSSLWYSRLNVLDKKIKHVSFHEIRDPSLTITDSLHDLREDLSNLQTSVEVTRFYVDRTVEPFFKNLLLDFTYQGVGMPIDSLETVGKRAAELHQFLLETFTLLMTTLSVKDSQQSIQQTKESLKQTQQSVLLTRLAAVYLPLSLTTGVFGMNLHQLNNTGPQIWIFVITGVVVIAITVLGFQLQSVHWQVRKLFKREAWGLKGGRVKSGGQYSLVE